MFKSPVPVFFFSITLIIASPSAANPASSEHDTPVANATSEVKTAKSYNMDVSFAIPGKQGRKFVTSYIKNNDESLTLIRSRSKRPFYIIDSVMRSYGLPGELKYLAVIESELKATATSRVGARGPWQLMAGTARELGLKVNGRSDERTNIYKSTRAAAKYLRDLHREFKDWFLVLAAYNAGPLPVIRAIHRAHSTNFWALERYLPKETRQHVKRFIATAYYFNEYEQVQPVIPAVQVDNYLCGQPEMQQSFPEFLGTL